jgi:hypothetical protein
MNLRAVAIRNGIRLSDLKQAYVSLLNECDILGIDESKRYSFLLEGIYDYAESNKKHTADEFIKSGYKTYNEYVESLLDEEGEGSGADGVGTVSTDFDPSVRPENMLDASKLKDELEDK